MKITNLLVLLLLFVLVYSAIPANGQTLPAVSLIPEPKETRLTNEHFQLSFKTTIIYKGASAKIAADLLNEFISAKYGYKLPVKANGNSKSGRYILIEHDAAASSESYQLSIGSETIRLSGGSPGLFYGMQTLQQLAPLDREKALFPGVMIKDEPRFGYRGLMLDVSRHFYSVGYIKKFLDVMSHFKLNRFHWHLTDDQGWRIEIKKYPKLQSVAAWREPVENLKGSEFIKSGLYGGYYTQEEIKDVVKYATSKFITIIPEIEMPGHSLAALAAYPELGCTGGPYKIPQHGGINKDVYCAGNEGTFVFLQDVLKEVISLFPGKYIHIGGDETPKDRWKQCQRCQGRIKDEGLKNEHELQSYFVQRIEKFLNTQGRQIIGWDEILEGGLAPNATVMSWRGENGGIAAARQQHDVIMSPYTYLYLDYYQGDARLEPPAFPALLPLEKVYSYEPYSDSLSTAQHTFIKGVQANIWSESIRDGKHADYMAYPRALALAEIAWSPASIKDYERFLEKLDVRLAALDENGVHFRIPAPSGLTNTMTTEDSVLVDLSTSIVGASVYYSLDGAEPSLASNQFTAPFHLALKENQPRRLKAIVVLKSGRQSSVYSATYEKKQFKEASSIYPEQKGINFRTTKGRVSSAKKIQVSEDQKYGSSSWFDLNVFESISPLGVMYEGYMYADADAIFDFTLKSDDGSVLYIDDEIVVDNDGEHATMEVSGSVPMRKGYHKIRLHYFDSGGGRHLEIDVKKKSEKYNLRNNIFRN